MTNETAKVMDSGIEGTSNTGPTVHKSFSVPSVLSLSTTLLILVSFVLLHHQACSSSPPTNHHFLPRIHPPIMIFPSLGLWQARYFQTLLFFLGFTLAYTMRICMSVAIVAMTDSSSANSDYKQYDWSAVETGYILSSFFWGYTITQIPAGYIAKRWSAKNLLTIGVLLCAILSLLTSVAADYGGWPFVCVCRVGMGLSQSVVLPCIHTLLSEWVPPHERARLGSLTYSGAQFGTVLSNVISGALAESRAGWPSIFYFFGVASIMWTLLFFLYGADSPSTHSRISEDEKRYIESSLGGGTDNKPDKEILNTPWREILTSVPVWALVVAHCGQNWGFWMLITEISIYMSSILGFKLSENGFNAALPYLTMMVLAFPVSWLSDYALKRGVRRIILRKVSNTLSQWGPGLALIGLCFTERGDTTLSVLILVIAVGANVGSLCGFQINHIDLSPNYAGILMSLTNCFASVVAVIAPLVVSVIVTDKTDISQWRTVFYLSAGIYFTSNTIFLIFASAERQWWDNPKAVGEKKSSDVMIKVITIIP